jgi:hypothetical protein
MARKTDGSDSMLAVVWDVTFCGDCPMRDHSAEGDSMCNHPDAPAEIDAGVNTLGFNSIPDECPLCEIPITIRKKP